MKTYHLFHVSVDPANPRQMAAWLQAGLGDLTGLETLGMHRPVAIVEAEDPEDLFRKTNSIVCSWTENEGVIESGEGLRSTSVGDIIVDLAREEALVCASIGWDPLPAASALEFLTIARAVEASRRAPAPE